MIPQNKQIKELETEKNSHRATFKLGDEIGWRRIAKIGESILNARFYISTNGNGITSMTLDVISLKGWEPWLNIEIYKYSNSMKRHNKARLLTLGNKETFLEIYDFMGQNNNGILTTYVDNADGVELMRKEIIVPEDVSGYIKTQINF